MDKETNKKHSSGIGTIVLLLLLSPWIINTTVFGMLFLHAVTTDLNPIEIIPFFLYCLSFFTIINAVNKFRKTKKNKNKKILLMYRIISAIFLLAVSALVDIVINNSIFGWIMFNGDDYIVKVISIVLSILLLATMIIVVVKILKLKKSEVEINTSKYKVNESKMLIQNRNLMDRAKEKFKK